MKTMDELTMEELQLFWENEIALFGKYLAEEGKLKADTIDKHMDRIQFMTTVYFVPYGIDYKELQGETIVDFLGYFYISKMLSSSKSDVAAYLSSFKKWVQFLRHTEKISAEQYLDVVRICKHKEFFIERFDRYMEADDDRAMQNWLDSNDIEDYLLRQELEPSVDTSKIVPMLVDNKLVELWMNGETEIPMIVSHFRVFLFAVKEAGTVKLTTARKHLPRKFWKELDEKLSWQLFHKATLNQDNVPLFQFFFYAAQHLGLIAEIKQQCVITHQADGFLAFTGEEQAVILLDALWNKVAWAQVQESNDSGRPEVTQASRARIAQVLASWPVDEPQDAYSDWMRNKLKGSFLTEVPMCFFIL